uniref:type I-G CRISPR-associated protein Csb2 n=1 Tax=Symbiobacterium terraclitae TaxID=557451 RepID=UPI0035B51EE2
MTAIALRFLAGRFHATPWGHHVNEGVPEWPPSPWRLLRALVASAKRARPDLPDDRLAELLAQLAAPPHVSLPPACPGMSRHWMPWFKKGPRDRTLVFDSFLALDPHAEVVFCWPNVVLSDADRELLRDILAGLTYFGRAESWAEARLVDHLDQPNCLPVVQDSTVPADAELVEVLAPEAGGSPLDLLHALMVDTGDMRSSNRLVPAGSRWVTYARPAG